MSDPTSHNALTKALTSSFVDNSFDSDPSLRVRLLANAPTGGTKVMSVLEKELQECERFDFSVAFVTRGGEFSRATIFSSPSPRPSKNSPPSKTLR